MATAITFDALQKRTDLTYTVYLKQYWGGSWVEEQYLYPAQVEWRAAPTIPTATLAPRYYGRGLRDDKTTWELIERLADKRRWFVKIVFDVHTLGGVSDDLEWYGILDVDSDRLLGVRRNPDDRSSTYESGEQELTCYGMAILLARHKITSSYWMDSDTHETHRVDIAPDFNANGEGNRSTPTGVYSSTFSDVIRQPDESWSTREIVRYLLAYQVPHDTNDIASVIYSLEDPDQLLPDWDTPVIPQFGRTTLEVLSDLFPPSHLLGYYLDVEVEPTSGGDIVLLKPFTYLENDLQLTDGIMPANPRQFTVNFETDPDTHAMIRTDSVQQFDQVIYRGARRRSCCSMNLLTDRNIEIGWNLSRPPGSQAEYEDGASTDPSYPAATEIDERQRADAEARSADIFTHIFSRFVISLAWTGYAHNGYDGLPASSSDPKYPVFPVDGDESAVYDFNPRELRFLPSLPLLDGHDYETIPDDWTEITTYTDGPWAELPPVVFSPLPEDDTVGDANKRWVQLDRNAEAADVEAGDDAQSRTWSAEIEVLENDRSLLLKVHGAPQHAIAYGQFTPQAHEADLKWGEYDYYDFVFLVAIEDQRYCEGRYPPDEDLDRSLSYVRTHEVDMGDGYKLDYLVPGTLVGLEPDTGNPITSTGGYIRDDRPQLEQMAEMAYAYLGVERRGLTIQTHRINSALKIGDYITQIGSNHTHTINACVTAITLQIDHADGPNAGPPQIEYQTGYVEQAALQ